MTIRWIALLIFVQPAHANVVSILSKQDGNGGYYDSLDQDLLPLLLDAGLPFLLRWSLDDSTDSLIAASVRCFTALLVRKPGEVLVNRC